MNEEFSERDLLLPYEQRRLRRGYREFFKAKRKHFFATIGYFEELWDSFQLLDEVWQREIENVWRPEKKTQILPAMLLIMAHGKCRIAAELAFSGCLADAWSIMRTAIECGAHARRIHLKPELTSTWLSKDDGEDQAELFKREFWYEKKNRLFEGLDSLYEYWQLYSEWGSHSTAAIMALRTKSEERPEGMHVEVSYLEGDESRMALSLHWLLDAGWLVENVLFEMFKGRFQFDALLLERRKKFKQRHSRLREAILARYGKVPEAVE